MADGAKLKGKAVTPAQSIPEARQTLLNFMMTEGPGLPDDVRLLAVNAMAEPSPVDQLVSFGELMYARAAEVNQAARDAGAMAIEFAARQNWHGLQREDRAVFLLQTLEAGERPEGAPAPQPRFVKGNDPVTGASPANPPPAGTPPA